MENLDRRQYAPAFQRNCDSILTVLQQCLPSQGIVLEIASGTGEHAACFAHRFPHLQWLPSDVSPSHLESIAAWRHQGCLENLCQPMALDMLNPSWPDQVRQALANVGLSITDVVAIVNINMIHIAPWEVTVGLMTGAAKLLSSAGFLYLYGPFIQADQPTAPSNLAFDQSLRSRDSTWGIRHLEDVVTVATQQGLILQKTVVMPANNLSVIWQRCL